MTYALRTLGLLASLIATACELPTEPETRASAERETRSSPQRPTAVTLSATSVTQSGARINGRVNPNGSATTWSIEYGTTTGLGQVCNGPAPLNGTTPVNVWCTFDGAPAGATRYYRVVASNGAGRSTGEIVQFTTLSGNTGNTPDQNLVALLTASSFWFDRTGAYGRTFRFTTANATGGWNGTGTYIRCLAVNCGGTSVQFGFAWRLDGNRLRVYNNVGGPQNQEDHRVRQHHRDQRADAGALHVLLREHHHQREVRHQRRDDVRRRIADAVRGLGQLRRDAQLHEHRHEDGRQQRPLRGRRADEQVHRRTAG
jgi:hypothetical protein